MKKILTEQRLCELAGIVNEARSGDTQEIRPGGTEELGAVDTDAAETHPGPVYGGIVGADKEQLRADLARAQNRLKRFFFADPIAQDREQEAEDFVTGTKSAADRLQGGWASASELADAYREFKKIPSDISPQDIKRALLVDPKDYWLGRNRPNWKKLRADEPELAKIAIRIADATDFDFLELDSLRKRIHAPAAALANLLAQPWRQSQQDAFDEEVVDAREQLATRDPDRKGAGTPQQDHLRRVQRLASSLSQRATDDVDAGPRFVEFFSERATEEYKDIVTNPKKLEAALKEFDNLVKQTQQQLKSGGAAPRGNRPARAPKSWLPQRAGGTWKPPKK